MNDEDRFYFDGVYDPYLDSDYHADFGGRRLTPYTHVTMMIHDRSHMSFAG